MQRNDPRDGVNLYKDSVAIYGRLHRGGFHFVLPSWLSADTARGSQEGRHRQEPDREVPTTGVGRVRQAAQANLGEGLRQSLIPPVRRSCLHRQGQGHRPLRCARSHEGDELPDTEQRLYRQCVEKSMIARVGQPEDIG